MDFQQASEFALSLARERHERDVDVLVGRNQSLSIKVLGGKVEKVDQSTSQGLGLRVLREGRTGIAYTERMDPEAIERAFLAAGENADLNDRTEVEMVERVPTVPDPETLELYNPALDDLTLDDLAQFGLAAEEAALAGDPRVKAVPALVVKRSRGIYQVASSHGLQYGQEENSVGAYCSVMLEENGVRKSGGHQWSAREWAPEKGEWLGREAARKGAALMGARPISGGALPVVLDEETAPALLGMYFSGLSAESVQKGLSRFKDKVGQPVAGESIQLLDDPHRKGAPGSRFLDAEGTPTAPLPILENGVLRNLFYHVESARREGRQSTGHAGRGYNGGIGTRSHSLVMNPGEYDLDALCALTERCLLITELEGGAGCNPVSGDISIGVQGFLVENGRRTQPVDSVTIAGNFFDLLQNIQALGDRYQPNLSNRFIPAMLVEGFVLSG